MFHTMFCVLIPLSHTSQILLSCSLSLPKKRNKNKLTIQNETPKRQPPNPQKPKKNPQKSKL